MNLFSPSYARDTSGKSLLSSYPSREIRETEGAHMKRHHPLETVGEEE
jgi:hypothetical protein